MTKQDLIYILIVNWNNWPDTLECLESVFRNNYPNYKVILCDNGSKDDSLNKLRLWAEGLLNVLPPKEAQLKPLAYPPLEKPIPHIFLSKNLLEKTDYRTGDLPKFTIIQNGADLGFAGGNNIGFKVALRRGDFKYIWLLNNDTLITPNALNELANLLNTSPRAGMCGSTLIYYHAPQKIQAFGGAKYNRWLGTSRAVGAYRSVEDIPEDSPKNLNLNYVNGASMLVRKEFLQEIGLMSEDYFHYFDEIDWAERGKDRYGLTYAPKSMVYHREGGTVNSNGHEGKVSLFSDYFSIKNRILFTKKYFPYALPTVYLGLLVSLAKRLKRNQWDRIRMIIELALGKKGKYFSLVEKPIILEKN